MNEPTKNYVPAGMTVVTPYFCVEGADGFIAFLKEAFGATVPYIHYNSEGNIVQHARISIDGCIIELSGYSSGQWPARQFTCQLFVPDCDAVYAKAIAAGATSLGEPADAPYGLRAGYVQDAWGNQWYISTQIDDKYSPENWSELD